MYFPGFLQGEDGLVAMWHWGLRSRLDPSIEAGMAVYPMAFQMETWFPPRVFGNTLMHLDAATSWGLWLVVAPSANTTSGAWRWLCTTGFWRVPAGPITRKTLGDEMASGCLGGVYLRGTSQAVWIVTNPIQLSYYKRKPLTNSERSPVDLLSITSRCSVPLCWIPGGRLFLRAALHLVSHQPCRYVWGLRHKAAVWANHGAVSAGGESAKVGRCWEVWMDVGWIQRWWNLRSWSPRNESSLINRLQGADAIPRSLAAPSTTDVWTEVSADEESYSHAHHPHQANSSAGNPLFVCFIFYCKLDRLAPHFCWY
jgi:hypothetical protein